jgi:hypothetical protein
MGCAGVTIRCIGLCWACLQGCPAVGSVRELLTYRGGVVIGISAPTWVTCLGRVGLACGMCGPRRRFDPSCMLCVLVLIMIVWIFMTPCSPL